jgi:hypothetical protein
VSPAPSSSPLLLLLLLRSGGSPLPAASPAETGTLT